MDPATLALHAGLDGVLQVQSGVIRRDQAQAAGLLASTINSHLARGRWTRILPRVYTVGTDVAAPETRIRAAFLWAGDDSVVTGDAAAWWWGMTAIAPATVEVIVPLARRMSAQPGYSVTRAELRDEEIACERRIRVTTPAATCLWLTRSNRPDHVEAALRKGLRSDTLAATLRLGVYRHGQPRAAATCADAADNPWSQPERLLQRLFREAGITGWIANAPLRLGVKVVYPDVRFDREQVIVEVDGRSSHSTPEQHDADHQRQNALTAAGWTVVRFTPRQIIRERETVVGLVRATIERLNRR